MHLTFWEDPDFVWKDFDNFYWKICNLEWFLYAMFRINFPKPPVTHTNYLLLAVNTIWISCELMELKSHMWALNLDSKAGDQRLNVIHTFSRLITFHTTFETAPYLSAIGIVLNASSSIVVWVAVFMQSTRIFKDISTCCVWISEGVLKTPLFL